MNPGRLILSLLLMITAGLALGRAQTPNFIVIEEQPAAVTKVNIGERATLSIDVRFRNRFTNNVATTPLSYQWYRGRASSTGDPIGTNNSSGATATLTTAPIFVNRYFWCRVTGIYTTNDVDTTITFTTNITTSTNGMTVTTTTNIVSTTNTTTTAISITNVLDSNTAMVMPVGTNVTDGNTEFRYTETFKQKPREFRNSLLEPQVEVINKTRVYANLKQSVGPGFKLSNMIETTDISFSLGDQISYSGVLGDDPKFRVGGKRFKLATFAEGTNGNSAELEFEIKLRWSKKRVLFSLISYQDGVFSQDFTESGPARLFGDESVTATLTAGDLSLSFPVRSEGRVKVDNYEAHTGRTLKLRDMSFEGYGLRP